MEKYFKTLKKGAEIKLKADIHYLQTCANDTSFLKATELISFKEWRKKNDRKIDEFIQYFREQWSSKRSSRYERAVLAYPSTDNGMDAINSIIKSEHTLRGRLPAGQFFCNVVLLIANWSKTRNQKSVNGIQFAEVRSILLVEWTIAYQ